MYGKAPPEAAALDGPWTAWESEPQLKKQGIAPKKVWSDYEAVVARSMVPFIKHADERTPRDTFDVAHCLRDGGTVLAGSALTDGPYGDLLYRVSVGASGVVQALHMHDTGSMPQIDPANTVEPPLLRQFLNTFTARFADALSDTPAGTWRVGLFTETLQQLAGQAPEAGNVLLSETSAAGPFKRRVYPPDLDHDDLLDMTQDPELAESVALQKACVIVVAAALTVGVFGAGTSQAALSFSNCTAMHHVYPHGVGRRGAHDHVSATPVTNFKRSSSLYRANRGLDREGDAIACEKR